MFWEKGALIVFVTNLIIQNDLLEEHCISFESWRRISY